MNSMKQYEWYKVEDCSYFSEFLRKISEKYKDGVAFQNGDKIITYKQFEDDVKRYANYFNQYYKQLFVLDIEGCYTFACVYFATIISGNISVLCRENETNSLLDNENYILVNDEVAFRIKDSNVADFEMNNENEDCCTIVCSSGTTSQLKGVMLSQKNLLSDTIAGMRCYEYKANSVYLNIIPYTHLFGIVADLLGPLYSGGCICYGDKLAFFENLRKYKPTNLNLPPALVNAIFKLLISTNDFAYATGGRLKKVMCAGAKMNDNLNNEFEKYGMRVYSAYGLTECSPCVSLSRDDFYKKDSAGLVMPCNTVEIVEGEVVVSGSNVMLGYYNNQESTNLVIREGKLYTGDLGYLDEDNFLYITGRKSNLIVFSDGTKILPEIIETKLNEVNGVEESLVKESEKKEHIDIRVVSVEGIDKNYLKSKVDELLKELNIIHRVYLLKISTDPLKKNKLGKVSRKE